MKQELGNLMAEDPQQETINLLNYRLNAVSTELAAVTEQRDGLRSGIDYASDQLTRVTEQRDRLAEALQEMWPFIEEDDYPACNTSSFNAAIKKYKEALQSLNQTTP